MDDLSKKLKVDLTKIPYQNDVALRMALPELKEEALLILNELVFSSLETTVEEIAEAIDSSEERVDAITDELLPLKLFTKAGEKISLQKEKRRLLETELLRFEKEFHPDLNYLKGRLSALPPSVLLDWYVVPRTCHDIFDSLIEKHFLYPRLFQRYLEELRFDDVRLETILKRLYQSDQLYLSFEELKVGFGLSRQELHTWILKLEYHFAAFLKYVPREGGGVEEVIVPLKEWVDYVNWIKKGIEPAVGGVTPVTKLPSIERSYDLKERQVKGVERRLKGAKSGDWIPLDQFLNHLDVEIEQPHELLLETKGRKWAYRLPSYKGEEKAAFRSLLFERFAKTGVLLMGQKEGDWYFSLTSKGKEYLI